MSSTCNYPWSSYGEYLGHAWITDVHLALSLLSDIKSFCAFHNIEDPNCSCVDLENASKELGIDDEKALEIIKGALQQTKIADVACATRKERDMLLRRCKETGLPIRQISRIIGVPRSTITRA